MAQSYDVSLKVLFLSEGDGIIRRLLFGGGRITEFLPTEQPQISNRRVDLLARTEDRSLRQVEFDASNEAGFALRMLEYYIYLVRRYGEHVAQVVLYLGRDPMRLERTYKSPSLDFRFEIVNLRELDAEPLLASPDWADNVLALLAKGSPEKALDAVIPRIAAMRGDARNWAGGTLLLLSGILDLEATVNSRLQEIGMIDVMENKVLGPMIEERLKQKFDQGLTQGKQQLLREQLTGKFGPLSPWAEKRLIFASPEDLNVWAQRILTAVSLEETLR